MNQNGRDEVEVVEEALVDEEEFQQLEQSLPKSQVISLKGLELVKYKGFWNASGIYFKRVVAFERHFRAHDTDLIIASFPKTGTTWLKSLLFAVVNRCGHSDYQNLLSSHNPHELVYNVEAIYGNEFNYPRPCHLNELPSPRLLHTHLPYSYLPESVKSSSGSRILYITRNPLDTFVSYWHFLPKLLKTKKGSDSEDLLPFPMEVFFEDFYHGRFPCAPFFDNMLEYWNQSLEHPNKVLFLKYEDLKEDAVLELKRLAEFVGMPFSPQEESDGVVEDIVEMCSIKNLKELQVNKSGLYNNFIEKKNFFRKGEVGDWTNYFTPDMEDRMKKLMQEKLEGTGLSFKLLPS